MTQLIPWMVGAMVACATEPDAPATRSVAGAAEQAETATSSDVVATIDGEPVTQADLMELAAADIIAAEVAVHEARSNALNAVITQRLVEAKADEEGISPDDLIKREVDDKIAEPTDAEIAAFYNENRNRMPASLDEMKPRLKQYLAQQQGAEAMRAFVAELEEGANVERKLDPYRVDVEAGDSPRWGDASAPVQIVEFSDFQCPYCSVGAETVDKIKEKYGKQVSIVYRHFPLPMHKQAGKAAEAAECANEQGKFWEYHDALFADTKAWTDDDYKAIAKDVGLKKKPFAECLESGKHEATVQDDMEAGRMVGMSGTPGFYINGIVLTGAQPIEVFADVIDRELAGN